MRVFLLVVAARDVELIMYTRTYTYMYTQDTTQTYRVHATAALLQLERELAVLGGSNFLPRPFQVALPN